MAAPNIASPTTITGKTAVLAVTTSAQTLIANAAASGTVCKVNALIAANVSGSAATVNIDVYRSSTAYNISYTISVPAAASLDVLNRYIYLEEGDTLRATASANSAIQIVSSYELIA